MHLGS